jgi:hypothetical protein
MSAPLGNWEGMILLVVSVWTMDLWLVGVSIIMVLLVYYFETGQEN